MEGLHIIAEHMVTKGNLNFLSLTIISLIACIMAAIPFAQLIRELRSCGAKSYDLDDWIYLFAFGFGALACALVVVFSLYNVFNHGTRVEYTAIIDENIDYGEFAQKYDILSEEDGVYRIREKEDRP